MSRPLSDGPATRVMRRRRRRALTYDDLPKEIKGVIQDYVAFTNADLRAAVEEYFADDGQGWQPSPTDRPRRRALERRHGKIGTWNVKFVTDMSRLFEGRREFNEDIGAWDTSI